MKTFYLFPSLLALMIQVIINGQTQRILPVLGAQIKNSEQKAAEHKVYPVIISEEKNESAQKNNAEFSTVIDNNTFNYFSNTNCYATAVFANELIKQAEELEMICDNLRAQSKKMNAEEKSKMLKEANQLQNQACLKKIQASEISGKISMEKFKNNEASIAKLTSNSLLKESIMETALEINSAAKHEMKMAREFREEAYSVNNNMSKLGMMSNAEEKEFVALSKQDEAIALLKSTVALCENTFYDLAVR